MCALFTKEQKIKPIPRTEGSLAGEDYLKNLIGGTPNVPLQGTADLTPMQMAIQQSLPQLMGNVQQAGDLASQQYMDTLSGGYDPRTSPYYEGLRQEAELLKREGVTSLRRGAEMGGMLSSSNAAVAEASFINQADTALLTQLGNLFETERGRQFLAAEGLQGVESKRLLNIAAVGGMAEQERLLEQQRNDALYNQLLKSIMIPYIYQAKLASSLMNYQAPYALTGGGLTDWGFMLAAGAQALGGGGGSLAGTPPQPATNAGVAPADAVLPTWNEQKAAMSNPNYY